ncbi:MAG TPA: FecR domain-containing protein [Paraburkholderia sp.]
MRAWWVRLRSGRATRDDANAYENWRGAQPEHAQVADEFSRAWTALHAVATEIAEEQPGARSWQATARHTRNVRAGRRAFVGFAVTAGVSWLAFYPPLQLWPALGDFAADYRTGTGERRQIALSDRVSVDMNTQTRINVLSAQAGEPRHGVNLLAGEAEVVAAASGRGMPVQPVVVVAGRGRLSAEVARFDVRRAGSQVCVTCISGTVAVEHPAQHVTLTAAQQVTYDDARMRPVSLIDPAVVTAWREGRLVFKDVPLAQVIDEINRYRPGKVILRNAALANSKVRAEIEIARIDGAVSMLSKLYNLRVVRLPGQIALLT